MDLGELKASLVLDDSGLQSSASSAVDSLKAVDAQVNALVNDLGNVSGSMKSAIPPEAAVNLQAQAQALGDVSAAFKALNADLLKSAGTADDLRDSLKGAFGDNADSVAEFIDKVGTAQGVLKNEDLEAGAKTLQKLGAFTEENLQLIADVAVATGGSIDGLATSFGKFEQFGDAKSFKALQRELGITQVQLEALNVEFDDKGKIVEYAANVDKAKEAIKQLSNEKFGGALAAVSDDAAKFDGQLELLKQSIGASTLEFQDGVKSGLLPYIQGLQGLSAGTKAAIGNTVLFAGSIGGGVASIASFAATMKIINPLIFTQIAALAKGTAAWVARAGAMALGFAAEVAIEGPIVATTAALSSQAAVLALSVAGLTLIAGAAATAAIAYTTLWTETEKANDALLKSDSLRDKGKKDVQGNASVSTTKILNSSASDLAREGVTVNTVNQRILDEQRGAENLKEQGDLEAAKRAQARVVKLRAIRVELEAEIKKQAAAEDALAEAQRPRTKEEIKAAKAQQKIDDKKQKESLGGAIGNVDDLLKAVDADIKDQEKIDREEQQKKDKAAKQKLSEEKSAERKRAQEKKKSDKEITDQKKKDAKEAAAQAKQDQDIINANAKADEAIAEKKKNDAAVLKKTTATTAATASIPDTAFNPNSRKLSSTEFSGGVLTLDQFLAQQSADFGNNPFQNRLTDPNKSAFKAAATAAPTSSSQSTINGIAGAVGAAVSAANTAIEIPVTVNVDGKTQKQTFSASSAAKGAIDSAKFNSNFVLGEV